MGIAHFVWLFCHYVRMNLRMLRCLLDHRGIRGSELLEIWLLLGSIRSEIDCFVQHQTRFRCVTSESSWVAIPTTRLTVTERLVADGLCRLIGYDALVDVPAAAVNAASNIFQLVLQISISWILLDF
jgi:hypothetical protein